MTAVAKAVFLQAGPEKKTEGAIELNTPSGDDFVT